MLSEKDEPKTEAETDEGFDYEVRIMEGDVLLTLDGEEFLLTVDEAADISQLLDDAASMAKRRRK